MSPLGQIYNPACLDTATTAVHIGRQWTFMDNVTLIEKLFVCLFHYPLRAHCHWPVFMNGGGGGEGEGAVAQIE